MKNNFSRSLQAMTLGLLFISSSAFAVKSKNNQQLSNDVSALQQQMSKLSRLLDNRAMLELFQRMDELADEVSELRGMLEQQNHDLAGLKKRQRELYLDTDRRLRELEITSNRAPAAGSSSPPAAPTTSSPALRSKPQAAVTTPPPVVPQPAIKPAATRPATVSTSKKPAQTMSEERAAYQKAFDMLKEGRYKMANAAFIAFVARYPGSSYAGNSQYWLGESNYVTQQFKQAVQEFQKVVNNYPNSNKVPDAMLKLGYTYYELREFDKAKAILNKLRKTYPKSSAGRLAGKRLDRMNKEGL